MTSAEPLPGPETPRHPDAEQINRCREVLGRVQEVYRQWLAAAVERGFGPTEIEASLVNDWKAGRVPRVVEGLHSRGESFVFHVLHGEVPAGILTHGNQFMVDRKSVVLAFPQGLATQPNPDDPSAFYIETMVLPQRPDDQRFRAADVAERLTELDALLPPAQ